MKAEELSSQDQQELENYQRYSAKKYGDAGLLFLFVLMSVLGLYNNSQEAVTALATLFLGYLTCEAFGLYTKTKKTSELVKVVIGGIITVILLTFYLYKISIT